MSEDGNPTPGPDKREIKHLKRPGQPIYHIELLEWAGGMVVTRMVFESPAPWSSTEIEQWSLYARLPKGVKRL